MPHPTLRSDRLTLVPASVAHVQAELVGASAFGTLLGAAIPASWPPGEYDESAQRFFLECLLAAGEDGIGWYGWYAIRNPDAETIRTVVGAGGYFGPPTDGLVEIGYSMCDEWRGQGYATEIVRMLVMHALKQPTVTQVVAHTTAANRASIRVLERAGFIMIGTGVAPDSWRYEFRE